ncbi:MAG TPA: 30S ribosomal protein S12 methylthiotransferase RimO [Bacteroidales bacterium]|nr:30S ribosomal protein S12 methylthiotransferase RimO [Bacteroidales bacterium]
MLKMKRINIVTLGCSKNTVDSEILAGYLANSEYEVLFDSDKESDYVVINTCGFINDAKEESISTILDFGSARRSGKIEKLIVMGCLSQRYKQELIHEIPEVDVFYGVNDIRKIVCEFPMAWSEKLPGQRPLSTPGHYAYVKIAEGCDRRCSFCAIPMIRGKHCSKSMDSIAEECRTLVQRGVKELLLIAQDLTYYGVDLYGYNCLDTLVNRLAEENPDTWIRLHYTFPLGFTDALLNVFQNHPNVVNYIDIPLQHINSRILKSMHRGIDREGTRQLIQRFREKLPEAAIRTAFIVGYPGETEEEFQELKDFISEFQFERMGIFTYSHEENTAAFELEDNIPQEIKDARRDCLMDMQQNISRAHNRAGVGKILTVLIDRQEGEYWIARTEFDSPEIDNEVLIHITDRPVVCGSFRRVKIIQADDYDLFAELAD